MLKVDHIETFGWEGAIRGMRNPMNSWAKSDTTFELALPVECKHAIIRANIGENDLKLMQNLAKAGDDHGKFLRMITVTCDIIAPLYWWKEMDCYKVGTVADSCSTMHKIAAKPFTIEDFSHEHLLSYETDAHCMSRMVDRRGVETNCEVSPYRLLCVTVDYLNDYRTRFLATNDKLWWWQMIQLLPSSYNQRRTWQGNYQVLKHIYHARKDHKLDEWHTFCNMIEEQLPYAKELIIGGN